MVQHFKVPRHVREASPGQAARKRSDRLVRGQLVVLALGVIERRTWPRETVSYTHSPGATPGNMGRIVELRVTEAAESDAKRRAEESGLRFVTVTLCATPAREQPLEGEPPKTPC